MRQHISAVGSINRHVGRAKPIDGKPDAQHLHAIGHPDVDEVALLDTQRGQASGRTFHAITKFAVTDRGAISQTNIGAIGMVLRMLFQYIAQHAIFPARHARIHDRGGLGHHFLPLFPLKSQAMRDAFNARPILARPSVHASTSAAESIAVILRKNSSERTCRSSHAATPSAVMRTILTRRSTSLSTRRT